VDFCDPRPFGSQVKLRSGTRKIFKGNYVSQLPLDMKTGVESSARPESVPTTDELQVHASLRLPREALRFSRRSAEVKTGLCCAPEHMIMGQLLVTLIVPPIVGLITYIAVRRIWIRDEDAGGETVERREPSVTDKREEMPANSP